MSTKLNAALRQVMDRLRPPAFRRTQEHRATLLLESVGEGVLSVDRNARIIFNNQAALQLLGFEPGELDGRDVREMLHHRGRPECPNCTRHHCLLSPAFSGDEATHSENEPIWRKDRSSFVADISCTSIWSAGKHHGAVLTFRDVTRRREIEDRLRVQGAALESAANSIIILDREENIVWANQSFSRQSGYTREEVVGSNAQRLLTGDGDAALMSAIRETLGGREPWQGELATFRKDGARGDQEITIAPVLDEQGEATNFIWIMLDVTERKRSDEALRQSTHALQEANRQLVKTVQRANDLALKAERASEAKSEFLANMSHEIRTPMNAIVGASHLLRDTTLSVQQTGYLQTLMTSADLLLGTISDVLDFSKIEAGKLEISSLGFEPQAVLNELLSIFSIRAEEKGLTLHVKLDPGIPDWLVGDPMRLTQILNNLLSNALKFTWHGYIIVSAEVSHKSEGRVELLFTVSDSGIGILPANLSGLFRAFTQVDGSVTRTYGGTGLGLAICKRLTTLMGGEIWCESVAGRGSTFSFRLPFLETEGGRGESRDSAPRRLARFRQQRVLLVEDNLYNQKVALALLEKAGLCATLACNGAEAVELVQQRDFDIVLMDVQMPVMDGLTATRHIRKLARRGVRSLPILAVSANATEQDVKASLDSGMDAHITKPFSPDTLYNAIAKWLEQRGGRGCDHAELQGQAVGARATSTASTGAPPGGANEPRVMVDLEEGLRLVGGDGALYQDLLQRFELEYEAKGEEIRHEVGRGNLQQAAHLVHSVKGVSGVLGAQPLLKVAKRLELVLRQGEGEVEPLLDEFQAELDQTIAYLRAR